MRSDTKLWVLVIAIAPWLLLIFSVHFPTFELNGTYPDRDSTFRRDEPQFGRAPSRQVQTPICSKTLTAP